jgi:hypothetical protein
VYHHLGRQLAASEQRQAAATSDVKALLAASEQRQAAAIFVVKADLKAMAAQQAAQAVQLADIKALLLAARKEP